MKPVDFSFVATAFKFVGNAIKRTCSSLSKKIAEVFKKSVKREEQGAVKEKGERNCVVKSLHKDPTIKDTAEIVEKALQGEQKTAKSALFHYRPAVTSSSIKKEKNNKAMREYNAALCEVKIEGHFNTRSARSDTVGRLKELLSLHAERQIALGKGEEQPMPLPLTVFSGMDFLRLKGGGEREALEKIQRAAGELNGRPTTVTTSKGEITIQPQIRVLAHAVGKTMGFWGRLFTGRQTKNNNWNIKNTLSALKGDVEEKIKSQPYQENEGVKKYMEGMKELLSSQNFSQKSALQMPDFPRKISPELSRALQKTEYGIKMLHAQLTGQLSYEKCPEPLPFISNLYLSHALDSGIHFSCKSGLDRTALFQGCQEALVRLEKKFGIVLDPNLLVTEKSKLNKRQKQQVDLFRLFFAQSTLTLSRNLPPCQRKEDKLKWNNREFLRHVLPEDFLEKKKLNDLGKLLFTEADQKEIREKGKQSFARIEEKWGENEGKQSLQEGGDLEGVLREEQSALLKLMKNHLVVEDDQK